LLVFGEDVKKVSAEEQRETGVMALVGGTIIDGNGGSPIADGVILIDGKRISAVGEASTQIPPHSKRISVAGKFIIPGFVSSLGTLVGDVYGVHTLVRFEDRYDKLALEAAQVALKHGITTVFDFYGPRDDLIKVRNSINEGKAIGSRIFLGGNWIGCDGPFSVDHGNWSGSLGGDIAQRIDRRWECNVGERLTSMSPAQVREEIRSYIDSGIDFLTVQINVHRYEARQFFQFSQRVLTAIVEEAHHAGLVVCGNCMYSEEGVWTAIDAGIDLPSLVGYLPKLLSAELIDVLAKRRISWPISPFRPAEWLVFRQRLQTDNEFARANESIEEAKPINEQSLLRAGVPVTLSMAIKVLSADTLSSPLIRSWGDRMAVGKSHFNDLLAARDIGMNPMDILQAATRNTARGFKVDMDLGTLERGKFADLLVLDRDPLEDTENYRGISVVIKDGKVIDRDALPTQRLLTAPLTSREDHV
jgi:imidazolonepropionase-like amidohydrolase